MRRRTTPRATAGQALGLDLEALYAHHADGVLVFLTRRTADPQIALDLWAETFAQATASGRRFRGRTGEEQAAWLYAIARRQLAGYYRRGTAERRALDRLELERPPADPELLTEIAARAGLAELRDELTAALHGLSPTVRDAVRLRVVDELAYPDQGDPCDGGRAPSLAAPTRQMPASQPRPPSDLPGGAVPASVIARQGACEDAGVGLHLALRAPTTAPRARR